MGYRQEKATDRPEITSLITPDELTRMLEPLMRLACSSLDCTLTGIHLHGIDQFWTFSCESGAMLAETPPGMAELVRTTPVDDDHRESLVILDNLELNGEVFASFALQAITLPDGETTGTIYISHRDPFGWTLAARRTLDDIVTVVSREYDLCTKLAMQKAYESQWHADAALFRHLADSLPDVVILLNQEAEITYCNEAIREVFGYSPQAVLHQSADMLTAGSFDLAVTQYVANAFNVQENNSGWRDIRMQGRHKDGSTIAIEVTLDMILDGGEPVVKLMIRHLGKQEQLEEELRAASRRYLQILDSIPDLVYVKDPGSRFVWANQAFVNFFNTTLDDLVGRVSVGGLGLEHDSQTLQDDHLVFTKQRKKLTIEESIVRHDGLEREFITTKTPILDEDGNTTLLAGISSDVTETKNVERYLMDALEEREALVQIRTDFVSMVSHEFRTPLSVILASVDILRDYFDRLSEEHRHDKLVTIEDQVGRLTQLMDDVLVVSRGDVKGLPFSPEPADVKALSDEIIEEVRSQFRNKPVPSIDFSFSGDTKTHNIDTNLFRHILQNLVSNALKYSPKDSEVRVSMNTTESSITLVVVDTGIGIPEAHQENLFQTFHRADNVGTIQGTGLGLAIVKRAVDTHGGTINFRSIENQGTMFVVKIDT